MKVERFVISPYTQSLVSFSIQPALASARRLNSLPGGCVACLFGENPDDPHQAIAGVEAAAKKPPACRFMAGSQWLPGAQQERE
jgi:hypothetical protein